MSVSQTPGTAWSTFLVQQPVCWVCGQAMLPVMEYQGWNDPNNTGRWYQQCSVGDHCCWITSDPNIFPHSTYQDVPSGPSATPGGHFVPQNLGLAPSLWQNEIPSPIPTQTSSAFDPTPSTAIPHPLQSKVTYTCSSVKCDKRGNQQCPNQMCHRCCSSLPRSRANFCSHHHGAKKVQAANPSQVSASVSSQSSDPVPVAGPSTSTNTLTILSTIPGTSIPRPPSPMIRLDHDVVQKAMEPGGVAEERVQSSKRIQSRLLPAKQFQLVILETRDPTILRLDIDINHQSYFVLSEYPDVIELLGDGPVKCFHRHSERWETIFYSTKRPVGENETLFLVQRSVSDTDANQLRISFDNHHSSHRPTQKNRTILRVPTPSPDSSDHEDAIPPPPPMSVPGATSNETNNAAMTTTDEGLPTVSDATSTDANPSIDTDPSTVANPPSGIDGTQPIAKSHKKDRSLSSKGKSKKSKAQSRKANTENPQSQRRRPQARSRHWPSDELFSVVDAQFTEARRLQQSQKRGSPKTLSDALDVIFTSGQLGYDSSRSARYRWIDKWKLAGHKLRKKWRKHEPEGTFGEFLVAADKRKGDGTFSPVILSEEESEDEDSSDTGEESDEEDEANVLVEMDGEAKGNGSNAESDARDAVVGPDGTRSEDTGDGEAEYAEEEEEDLPLVLKEDKDGIGYIAEKHVAKRRRNERSEPLPTQTSGSHRRNRRIRAPSIAASTTSSLSSIATVPDQSSDSERDETITNSREWILHVGHEQEAVTRQGLSPGAVKMEDIQVTGIATKGGDAEVIDLESEDEEESAPAPPVQVIVKRETDENFLAISSCNGSEVIDLTMDSD